jgi:3-hydroxyacyl-CoA dehydrogenase/enoyl-CoA hydratase/3-hydroxybutyryl-CoA epimerase
MTAAFDLPGRTHNVLNAAVFADLWSLLDDVEQDSRVRLLLFQSAKETGFLAGADLREMEAISDPLEAERWFTFGRQVFDRLERLPMPTVAVLHGPCLGGGLEFALACRYRVARDDNATQIGLPEVTLGLLPGWGGTWRLPQRVGLATALTMILEGRKITARQAVQLGLVDDAWPPDRFVGRLEQFVADRLEAKPLRRGMPGLWTRIAQRTRPGQWLILRAARRRIAAGDRHHPAPLAAWEAVRRGLRQNPAQWLVKDRAAFVGLLFHPACRNSLAAFFHRKATS